MVRKLKIVYDGPMDFDLEMALRQVMDGTGWFWYGEGIELMTGKRELVFYKKEDPKCEDRSMSQYHHSSNRF